MDGVQEEMGNMAGSMAENAKKLANAAIEGVSEMTSDNDHDYDDTDVGVGFGNDVTDNVSQGYMLTEQNQWGWITLYVVTIVLAILLNLLFIVGGLCTRRTRTTGYYLLLNLSVRDILLASLCMPFTLDSEIIALTWNYGLEFCIAYRYFYHAFLAFLPLTLLFLSFHLFVENCKWNFAGEGGAVPRPWAHTIYLPLIWFFSAAYAVPTAFFTAVNPEEDDLYKNVIARRPDGAEVCMHNVDGDDFLNGSNYFYFASTLVTFVGPFILLFIPWCALLVQACGCCTRKLPSSEFWLSIITLFMILFFEAARAPYELFNFHLLLTRWGLFDLGSDGEYIIPGIDGESYKAVMKWCLYAPSFLNPMLYFTFSPEARHGVYILFRKMCSCCCSKSTDDVEVASDDEKGRMLGKEEKNNTMMAGADDGVPLQSKQEEEM
jgi:hypothetical protein